MKGKQVTKEVLLAETSVILYNQGSGTMTCAKQRMVLGLSIFDSYHSAVTGCWIWTTLLQEKIPMSQQMLRHNLMFVLMNTHPRVFWTEEMVWSTDRWTNMGKGVLNDITLSPIFHWTRLIAYALVTKTVDSRSKGLGLDSHCWLSLPTQQWWYLVDENCGWVDQAACIFVWYVCCISQGRWDYSSGVCPIPGNVTGRLNMGSLSYLKLYTFPSTSFLSLVK